MSALEAKRTELKTALEAAGLFAFSTVPENAAPPFVYVAPGDPYITLEGATFGGVMAHHQVIAVTAPGVNEVRADELDALLEQVLAIVGQIVDDFEVGQPGAIAISGQDHIGAAIFTTTEIRLEGTS